MNELSPELTPHVLHPAVHQKLFLRGAELVTRRDGRQEHQGSEGRVQRAAGHRVVRRGRGGSGDLDVYNLLGLDADAYDTTPCLLEGPVSAP